MLMNSLISRGFGAILSASLLLTLALTAAAPAPAVAAPSYTCIAEVSTGFSPPISGASGTATLGSSTVTGATITNAASNCHAAARAAFNNNKSWSDPTQFCPRSVGYDPPSIQNGGSKTRLVWVTDYFKELGKSAGVNRVGGYSVVCDGPNLPTLQQLPTAPTVEKSTL
jgi:hypothetical protein